MTAYIPAGLTAVTPYLLVSDIAAALAFYRETFGAEEIAHEHVESGGTVVHSAMRIDGAAFEIGRHGARTGEDVAQLPAVGVHLYVADVDAVLARATALGSRVIVPLMDQPYGDREVTIADPFGVVWYVATHLHD